MLRIGVLMGGKSIEAEVSFNSGRTICDHLATTQYTVVPLFQTNLGILYELPWRFLHRGKIADFEHRLPFEATPIAWSELQKKIDLAFIALHGRYAEDGAIQGMLELMHIPYTGSKILSSALSMDKFMQKALWSAAGILTPRSINIPAKWAIESEQYATTILELMEQAEISFPCIVKPVHEGSALGVSQAMTLTSLCAAISKAASIDNRCIQNVLIEEQLSGMEFTCVVLYDVHKNHWTAFMPTEIVTEKNDKIYHYDQKYMPGRAHKKTPPDCLPEQSAAIQVMAICAAQVLELEMFARIDGFLMSDGRIYITDANSIPGMAPTSPLFQEAALGGYTHRQFIHYLVEQSIKEKIPDRGAAMQPDEPKKRKRIAIIMAGETNEREVSLDSGRNVTYKLPPHIFDAIPLFMDDAYTLYRMNSAMLVANTTEEIKTMLRPNDRVSWDELPAIADFVFNALHGGVGENGVVQGALETLGMPYNGSGILASALCIDKYKTVQFLKAQGFDVPEQYFITSSAWNTQKEEMIRTIEQTIPYPLVVKPHDDGCSIMVQKVTDEVSLRAAIAHIFGNSKSGVLVENMINGMEISIGVVGNYEARALIPTQTVAQKDILSIEEKFLPGQGENQTPPCLPASAITFIQKKAEEIYTRLGCSGYARIDCFYQQPAISGTGKERLVVLEINTIPALTPATCLFHQAAEVGITAVDLVALIIKLGFEKHASMLPISQNVVNTIASYQDCSNV